MVSQVNTEGYFLCLIVSKLRTDPYTTTNRYFGEYSFDSDELWSGSPEVLGGLRGISGLTLTVGETIPSERIGRIIIDNTRGVLGHNKQFIDLMVEEELIEQTIGITSFIKEEGVVGDTGGIFVEFLGVIKNIKVNATLNIVEIEAAFDYIKPARVGRFIDKLAFVDAPDQSVGKWLPLIFGVGQVPAYRTSDAGWNYANTQLADVTGVTAYYTTDYKGDWIEVESAASTTGTLYGNTGTVGNSTVSFGTAERGHLFTVSTPYIVTSVKVSFWGDTTISGTFERNCTVSIWTINSESGYPEDLINSTTRSFSYDSGDQNVEYELYTTFSSAVILEAGKTYLFTFGIDKSSSFKIAVTTDSAQDEYSRDPYNGDGQWYIATTPYALPYRLYGVVLTDSPTGGSFVATQRNISGQTEVDLNTLNFIVDVDGAQDDGSGSISGVANKPFNHANDAINYLITYVGYNNFDDALFDSSDVIETNYPRQIDGASQGAQLTSQVISEICKASACKLIGRKNGNVGLFGYGNISAPVKTITESDCTIISMDWTGSRTIANHVRISYDFKTIPVGVDKIVSGQPRTFAKSIDWEYDSPTAENAYEIDKWVTDSYNLYGDRELSDSFSQFLFLSDDASAEFLAKYYLTTRQLPLWTFDIELPYFKNDYRELELMDVISISHPDSPSAYGSAPEGEAKYIYYDGVENKNFNFGYAWRKAQRYSMRVIETSLNVNSEIAVIRLKLQVLYNSTEIF